MITVKQNSSSSKTSKRKRNTTSCKKKSKRKENTSFSCKKNQYCSCESCKTFFLDAAMHQKACAEMILKSQTIPVSDQCFQEHYFTTLRKAVLTYEQERKELTVPEKLLIDELTTMCTEAEEKKRIEFETKCGMLASQRYRATTEQKKGDEEKKLEILLKEQEKKILHLFLELDAHPSWRKEVHDILSEKSAFLIQDGLPNKWPKLKHKKISVEYAAQNLQYLADATGRDRKEITLDEATRLAWAIDEVIRSNTSISCYREVMAHLMSDHVDNKKTIDLHNDSVAPVVKMRCALIHRINEAVLKAPPLTQSVTLFRSQCTMRPFLRTQPLEEATLQNSDEGLAAHCLNPGMEITSTSFLECSSNQTLGVFGRSGKYPYWSPEEHGYVLIFHVPKNTPILMIEGRDHIVLPPYLRLKIVSRNTRPISAQNIDKKCAVTCYEIQVVC